MSRYIKLDDFEWSVEYAKEMLDTMSCEECGHWEHGAGDHYYCALLAMRQECCFESKGESTLMFANKPKDEPTTQTETQNSNLTFKTLEYCDICDHEGCEECIANALDEHCMPSQFNKQIEDECAKEYEELGLKELKELIEADHKTENSSEKPNNCDTCRNKGFEGCEQPCLGCGCCGLYEPKDEPQTDEEYINNLPWTEVGNGEQTDCDHKCIQTEIGCEKTDCAWMKGE